MMMMRLCTFHTFSQFIVSCSIKCNIPDSRRRETSWRTKVWMLLNCSWCRWVTVECCNRSMRYLTIATCQIGDFEGVQRLSWQWVEKVPRNLCELFLPSSSLVVDCRKKDMTKHTDRFRDTAGTCGIQNNCCMDTNIPNIYTSTGWNNDIPE